MYFVKKRNYINISNRYMQRNSKEKSSCFSTIFNQKLLIYFLFSIIIYLTHFSPARGGIACLSNPCFYGLCVDDVNSSYACYCMDGYTGTNCQTEWDECWSQPCLNGGECLDLIASYNCSCPEGFSGSACEFNRDECLSQPCLNNGTCIDGSNGFECHCLPGYSGSVCEWDISVCNTTDSERCLNGGACIEGPGEKFWCICTPGWGGILCEEPLDPCLLLQPCLHGGLCLARDSDYICACPFGFSGLRCEHELTLCTQNPCLNGAICVEEDDESICYCVPDYHGDLCQFQYDECLLPPTPSCKNGGTCIDGIDGFSCSCPPDVTGKFCECPIGFDCSNHSYHPVRPTLSSPKYTTGSSLYEITAKDISSTTEVIIKKTDKPSQFTSTVDDDYQPTTGYFSTFPTQTSKIEDTSQLSESSHAIDIFYTKPGITTITNFTDSFLSEEFSHSTSSSSLSSTKESGIHTISKTESPMLSSFTDLTSESSVYDTVKTYSSELPTSPSVAVSSNDFITRLSSVTSDSNVMDISTPTYTTEDTTSTQFGVTYRDPSKLTWSTDTFDGISPQETTTGLSVDAFSQTSKLFLGTTSSYQDGSITDSDLKFPSTTFGNTSVSSIPSTVIQDSVTDEAVSYSTAIDLETSDLSSSGSFGTTEIAQIDSTFSVPTLSTEQDLHQVTVLHSSTPQDTINRSFTHKFHSSPYTSTPSDQSGISQDTSSRQFTVPLTTISPEGKGTDIYTTDSDSSKRCDDKISPCLNGGTCVAYGDDFQCRCPLQFDGVNCERPSNMTEVSLLPASWLLFRVVTPAEETSTGSELSFSHRLEATLRIVSEEGVIFTLAEAEESSHVPSYHMQMSLLRGRLRLQFSCGLQSVRFSESKQRIDTGHPTKISASLTVWAGSESSVHMGRCRAELRLNNSLAVSGEQLRPLGSPRRHAAIAHLVFGAWPRGRHAARPPHALLVSEEEEDVGVGPAAPGVTACLSGVKVNGWSRLLLADITAGTTDVTECVQLACLSNPCLHGGTCEESTSATWSCRCPTGRLGARCEKSVCTNSPCEGGGTCLVHPGTNFVCLCPFGRQGVFCEQELLVSQPCLAPALVGVSPHLALPLTPRHSSFRHGLELSLRFTAARTHQVALLAYLGHGPRDHMALSYVHGRIMLTWDLGSGPRRVFTAKEFVAGVEREVEVGRAGREAWLRVLGDNGTHSGHSTGKMTQLNTRPVLLIGGFDRGNSSLLPHDLPKHSGFEGCVSNIEIKTGSSVTRYFPPGPPASPLRGRAVSQHSVQACASNPCLHRGICLPHGPSFTCLCAQGWFGPVCAEPSNPCDSKTSLCAEGSTCVPLLRGYECDCPLGKTGPFCRTVETRGTVVWPEIYFSGRRSYLEIPRNPPGSSDPGIPEHSCVEFEMKLSPASSGVSASAAQVLFFSRDVDTHDYMALILTSERDMQLLLGTGDGSPMQLRSPRGSVVRPGVWVRVRAGRVGRRVFLSVGGRPVSSWLLPGQAGDWSGGAAPLFIGGVPDLATVAPLVWSPIKPFNGCIRRLHVDWRKVLVHLGRAKVSPRGSQPFTSPAFQEPAVAQLTPEYLRQVQLSESWSSSSFGDDLTSFFQHESLAAFVSGQRENIQNWNPKDYNVVNQLKRKADPGLKSHHVQSKLTSLVTLSPQYNVTNKLERLGTSEMQNKLTTTSVAPTLLSRSLRSRDALFASTARNIRPCDKSSPAMVQLEPCSKDQVETVEGCQSLQYQVQQSSMPSTYPGFHGNGWLLIKVPSQFLKSSDIEWPSAAPFSFLRIRFSATQPNDLILWAQQDEPNGAFVGVGLKDGRLNVVWGNSDRGQPHFTTTLLSSSLVDGVLHSVSVLWDCSGEAKEAHVWVDGERGEVEQEHDRTRRKRQQQHTSPPSVQESSPLTIYLGGFPESLSVQEASLGHFKSALTGCIAELSWDDESAMLSEFASYPHSNVTPCK